MLLCINAWNDCSSQHVTYSPLVPGLQHQHLQLVFVTPMLGFVRMQEADEEMAILHANLTTTEEQKGQKTSLVGKLSAEKARLQVCTNHCLVNLADWTTIQPSLVFAYCCAHSKSVNVCRVLGPRLTRFSRCLLI